MHGTTPGAGKYDGWLVCWRRTVKNILLYSLLLTGLEAPHLETVATEKCVPPERFAPLTL